MGDDHCQVLAHKVILSAGSAYFKEVLKNNKHPYPLLPFQGITTLDLTAILDFIYNGELQLHEDHLIVGDHSRVGSKDGHMSLQKERNIIIQELYFSIKHL